jgi:hypothetical protein
LLKYFGEYFCFFVLDTPNVILRTIKEYVLFDGVSMKIQEVCNLVFLIILQFFDESFELIHFRDKVLILSPKHTIQVFSRQARSIVPENNAIWVQHRYNFEDNMLPHLPGFFRENVF